MKPVSAICGTNRVNFFEGTNGRLQVTIDTERLHLRPLTPEDSEVCQSWFGDPEVMAKYADGKTKTIQETRDLITRVWDLRWEKKDPFSAYMVIKKEDNTCIGQVMVGHSGNPGETTLGGLGKKDFWRLGYGTEVLNAVVKNFVPATVEKGYTLDGKVVTLISATALKENEGSWRVLEKLGFRIDGIVQQYGAERLRYVREVMPQAAVST